MRFRHSAFTVIELLLVVAVIAAILAFSFPVLGKIRGYSDNVKCINHLKGLGHAIVLFTQDHGGRMPPSAEYSLPGPVFGNQVPTWGPTWGEFVVRNYLLGDKTYLHCPARPKTWSNAAGYYLDYAYNERFCPIPPGGSEREGMRLASIQNPSKKILLGDAGRLSGPTMVSGYYAMMDAYRLFPRHPGNRVNVLYLDLHVESHHFIQKGTLPPIDAPLGRNAFDPAF